MMDDEFWKAVREREQASHRSSPKGIINVALLFGTAVIALTLILTPLLTPSKSHRNLASGQVDLDTMSTGSISDVRSGAQTGERRYKIRKSILQDGSSEP